MATNPCSPVGEDSVWKPDGRSSDKIGWLSWLTGFHMNNLISVILTRKGKLENEMVRDAFIGVDEAYATFRLHWSAETSLNQTTKVKKQQPSLKRALWRTFWSELVLAAALKLIWGVCMLVSISFFIRELLRAINGRTGGVGDLVGGGKVFTAQETAWWLCAFFFACNVLMCVCMQQLQLVSTRLGLRVKAALSTAIYRKVLVYDRSQSNADIVSLVATECRKLAEACSSIQLLWSGAAESAAIMGVLLGFAGISALPGCAIMLVFLPLQYFIGAYLAITRERITTASAIRVLFMDEVLRAIKLVKIYAWERKFSESVGALRAQEMRLARIGGYLKGINLTMVFILPPIMGVSIFGVYEATGQRLDVTLAFTTLSLFNTLRLPLFQLPKGLRGAAEAMNAIRRLEEFLLSPDVQVRELSDGKDIVFVNANLSYGSTPEPLLKNVNISIPHGSLVIVAGSVGCGKTNLLQAMLGNMTCMSGQTRVGGKFAYVPQTPWCAHGTVRDNIIFGSSWDESLYGRVVHACALERDLELMEEGDSTQIGERGMNLSGGQKQRIALARAAYNDADIVFLDSPLSAVDMYTCTHIFKHCIQGIFAAKKSTVVLVTHQVELFVHADILIFLDKGNITYTGPYDGDVVKKYFPFAEVVEEDLTQQETQTVFERVTSDPLTRTHSESTGSTDRVVTIPLTRSRTTSDVSVLVALQELSVADGRERADSISSGKQSNQKEVKPDATDEKVVTLPGGGYLALLRHFRWQLVCISLVIYVVTQVTRIYGDIWISVWVKRPYPGKDSNYYVGVYGGYVAAFLFALNCRDHFFYFMGLRAATRMHDNMFKAIVKAPMSYFTATPLGHLLKTFSGDMDNVDEAILDDMQMVVVECCILGTTFGVVIRVVPLFAVVMVVIAIAFAYYFVVFMRASRPLKDISALGSAFVVASISETLQGLDVILAYNAQARFQTRFDSLIDRASLGSNNLELLSMWLAFRLDTIASLLVLATCLLAVGIPNIKAADAGLAVSNSFQILIFFSLMVKRAAAIDANIASVERVDTLGRLPPEKDAPASIETCPPASWPNEGKVAFHSVVMSYAPGAPSVLKGVTFTILAGEKVGVAGRTGAGKSSLIMAIFRLADMSSGHISIDGVNILGLNLGSMRKQIAIIPQEPVMFQGTIRSNLDPFKERADEELKLVLRSCGLDMYSDTLDMPVLLMGTNFSLGQQQLICLARAMLNQSKLLLLDEATAALDSGTDAEVQRILRANFADRTMITIAHRLGTIIDSDKILVMDAGKVAEFDTPYALLSRPSIFLELCRQTGGQYESLLECAKDHQMAKDLASLEIVHL